MSACELSARVTPGDEKCSAYRRSGSETCRFCDVGPKINTVKDNMGDSMCNHKGCNKRNFVAGFCATHAPEHGHGELLQKRYDMQKARLAAKKIQPAAPAVNAVADVPAAVAAEKVIKHVEKAAKVQVKEVVAPDAAALVMSDMGLELDQLFKSKRAEWLFDLENATTIRSKAKMFLSMSDALDGMVY